ncbi:MAG: PAS domain S-box protein [Alphaproteobacteria bacterium]
MSMLIVSNTYIVQKSVINEFRNVANSISRNMSIQAATLYKANRLGQVEETFNAYGEYYPNIWFRVHYTEYPQKSFTYGNREAAPPFGYNNNLNNQLGTWYDVSYPIIVDDKLIGDIYVSLDTSRIKTILQSSIWQNIYLGSLEVLLGSVFALLIGLWLVSRLSDFEKASHRIRQGDYGIHLKIPGNDEISRTAQAFNQMSQELQKNVSALEAARNQFKTIFETAHDGILILDENGVITNCNRASLDIFGFTDSQGFIGKNFLQIAQVETYSLYTFNEFLEYDKNSSAEKLVLAKKKDNTQIYIKLSSSYILFEDNNYISVVIRDVTQSYIHEKQIIESEARLRAIVNTSLDGMIMLNADGKVKEFSPAAERILGFNRAYALNKYLASLIIPKEERSSFDHLLNFYRNDNKLSIVGSRNKISALRYDGSEFPAEITITSLTQAGEVLFVIFIRDITAQKKSESLLLDARNQAERANSAKTRFLAMMSHEIRTPIAGVIGILDLLDETELNNEQKELVTQAQNSSEDLLTILNDILDWSSVEESKLKLIPHDFSIPDMLRSTMQLMSPLAASKTLNFQLITEGQIPEHAYGDSGRIRQVIINLLSNAIKFTTHGDVILKITTSDITDKEFIFKISVKDQGPGISDEDKGLLFKEFSQLDFAYKNQKGGTGLGLAISHRLVKLMDGEIQLNSEINVGSEFIVRIPLQIAEIPEHHIIATEPQAEAAEDLLVLLAEDTQTNQFIVRKQLEESGYSVVSAWNGKEAVELCEKQHFHIILMDIAMPIRDGIEATMQIRTNIKGANAETPIIGLSAHAYNKDKNRALKAGMNNFLTKPVRKQTLLETLSQYWPIPNKQKHSSATTKTNKIAPIQNKMINKTDSIEINYDIYNQLLADLDQDLFIQILNSFPNDNSIFIENLNEMKDEITNSELAIRSAHSLKGSSASLGFSGLSKAAQNTEMAARNNDQQLFTQSLDPLFDEWKKTLVYISKLNIKN